jgi:hypothetical protein
MQVGEIERLRHLTRPLSTHSKSLGGTHPRLLGCMGAIRLPRDHKDKADLFAWAGKGLALP